MVRSVQQSAVSSQRSAVNR